MSSPRSTQRTRLSRRDAPVTGSEQECVVARRSWARFDDALRRVADGAHPISHLFFPSFYSVPWEAR